MLPYNAHKNSQGFTLFETLTVVIIIGILSALAAPSFLGMLNRNKVNTALSNVRGAFQEAQREAIRKSISCTVTLNKTTNTVTSTPTSCLVTGTRTFDSTVGTESTTNQSYAVFSHRGTITVNDGVTFVFFNKDNYSQKICLVISAPLGIIRSGTYTGQIPSNAANLIKGENCEK